MTESGVRFIDPPEPNARVIAAEIHGHVSAFDMQAYTERFEAIVARGEKALLYQDMIEYEGVDVGAIIEKLKHLGTYWRGLEKMAVVGDRRWLERYIGILDPITPHQIKYFSADQKQEAFAWLTG